MDSRATIETRLASYARRRNEIENELILLLRDILALNVPHGLDLVRPIAEIYIRLEVVKERMGEL